MRMLALFPLLALFTLPTMAPRSQNAPPPTPPAQPDSEHCPALATWFPSVSPSDAATSFTKEPKVECDFYQAAYANYLFAVQNDPVTGTPRFLGYKTYSGLFGLPPTLSTPLETRNLVAGRQTTLLALTPRLIKRSSGPDDFDGVEQAGFNNILIDQSGNPVYYAMHFNGKFADFVTSSGLLEKSKLANINTTNPNIEFPAGAIEFKSAWRLKLSTETDASFAAKYITTLASVPPVVKTLVAGKPRFSFDFAHAVTRTVGLIGLHVVFVPAKHPEFVWATFEHTMNAPEGKLAPLVPGQDPDTQLPWDRTSTDLVDSSATQYSLYAKGASYRNSNPSPGSVNPSILPDGRLTPSPSIYRLYPAIDPQVVDLNSDVLAGLRSPLLTQYKMVGAVWIDDPKNFTVDSSLDNDKLLAGEKKLSSTSMESFTQSSRPNCFSCHNTQAEQPVGPGKMPATKLAVSHALQRYLDSPDLPTIMRMKNAAASSFR